MSKWKYGLATVHLVEKGYSKGYYGSPKLSLNAMTRTELEVWRQNLLSALQAIFKLSLEKQCSLETRFLEEQDFGTYVRYKVLYQTRPEEMVPAYFLVPKGGPKKRPAVLCVHGHTSGGKQAVVDSGKARGIAYATELAKLGFVTLAPDNAGMGERSSAEEGSDCQLLWRRLNYLGKDITGYRVYDLMRGLDFLESRNEVDPSRLGVAGLSLGCWLSICVSALDERIKAAILSGYFTTFMQTSWVGHCICHHPFAIGNICEMSDIAALIAPRPIFVEWGIQDITRPVDPAYALAKRAYRLLGAEVNIKIDRFNGGHIFYGGKSLPWIVNQLIAET